MPLRHHAMLYYSAYYKNSGAAVAKTKRLFDLLDRLDDDRTVVTSVRQPAALRDAMKIAVDAGMDSSPNDASVNAMRDRLETFAQRLALDLHYRQHPEARPSLFEVALAAARMDGDPLADRPDLLEIAAAEVVERKPAADADDVLLYAAALARAGVKSHRAAATA
jgi:hypothetical protein